MPLVILQHSTCDVEAKAGINRATSEHRIEHAFAHLSDENRKTLHKKYG
jgi:hypothetical protein